MTEVDFCRQLRAWAEALGFVVYPEVGGWDLVLVPSVDAVALTGRGRLRVAAGEQLGIHAKLRANVEVLAQAIEPASRRPTYAFVAAPAAGRAFRRIAEALGVGVISSGSSWDPPLAMRQTPREASVSPPLVLPPIASACIEAGAPSPRQLSEWRVRALTFLVFARARDAVTVADLKAHKLHPARWVAGWLTPSGWKPGPKGKPIRMYRLGGRRPLPDAGYEDVAAELAAAPPAPDGARNLHQQRSQGGGEDREAKLRDPGVGGDRQHQEASDQEDEGDQGNEHAGHPASGPAPRQGAAET